MSRQASNDDDNSPRLAFLPPYRKIADDVKDRILDGAYAAGSLLPSRRDLAKLYGVDVNTIQKSVKLLEEEGLVSTQGWRGTFVRETRDAPKVLEAPNAIREIVGDRRLSVGIVTCLNPELEANEPREIPASLTVIEEIERTVTAMGGMTLFLNVFERDSSVGSVRRMIASMASDYGVQGVVVASPRYRMDVFEITRTSPIPAVVVEGMYSPAAVHQVYSDNREAGYRAAVLLLASGYEKIVYFAAWAEEWVDDRLAGIEDGLAARALPVIAHIPDKSDPMMSIDDKFERARTLARLIPPDEIAGAGIIGCNDAAASAMIDHAAKFGLAAGVDFSIVGYDDDYVARDYGLTSFRPPLAAMGRRATELLAKLVAGQECPLRISMNFEVSMRRSVRNLCVTAEHRAAHGDRLIGAGH